MIDLIVSIVLDKRYQIIFGLVSAVYFIWRQPRPRKGAGNRAVFVTGCDSGIGHRIARRLDELKVHVFAGCLLPEGQGAQSLKDSCSSRLHIVPLDVTDDKSVREAVAYVKSNLPCGERGLYGVVNNAGVLPYLHFDLTTLEMCQEAININLMGAIRVTKHFLPLVKSVPGRIVTITSIMARLTFPNTAVYAATKHALDAFFSGLRWDLAYSGIRFAVVEPGDFSTTTNIMQYTQRHLNKIWDDMSPDEKKLKRHLYEDAQKRVNKTKLPESKQEENYKTLLEDVEDALFAEGPYNRYVSASTPSKVVLSFLRSLPDNLYKMLVVKMLK